MYVWCERSGNNRARSRPGQTHRVCTFKITGIHSFTYFVEPSHRQLLQQLMQTLTVITSLRVLHDNGTHIDSTQTVYRRNSFHAVLLCGEMESSFTARELLWFRVARQIIIISGYYFAAGIQFFFRGATPVTVMTQIDSEGQCD
jgi:hypothetical protein